MTTWKAKNPDNFPAWMHRLVRIGWEAQTTEPGRDFEIDFPRRFPSKPHARTECNRFRLFRLSLRAYTMHPLAKVEEDYVLKTRTIEEPAGWRVTLRVYRKPADLSLFLTT